MVIFFLIYYVILYPNLRQISTGTGLTVPICNSLSVFQQFAFK